jgi:penicillin amidase
MVTRHGPVLASASGGALSLRWTAASGEFTYPLLDINRARNWEEFNRALSRWIGPGSNFVYADVDGNIGYHAAGRLPIRKGWLGDVPVDGASGDFEWQGFIPYEELPSAYNPPSGMVVTSNQNPFPENYPYPVNGNFASHYRSAQVREMLSSRSGWKPEDMIAIQKDVYSAFSHFLARQLVKAFDRAKKRPPAEEAVETLRGWNGQMEHSLAAPLIATLVYQHLRRAVAESASQAAPAYDSQMAPAIVEKLLRTRPAGWFADWDGALMRALADALDEGRRMQGSRIADWSYGRYTELRIANPIVRAIPLIGRYFTVGPVPMSGSSTTVKQTTRRLGPSMRMAADLGDWDRSLLNLVLGQSGQPLSAHYRDQWESYYTARSFPMQYRNVKAADTLRLVPAR